MRLLNCQPFKARSRPLCVSNPSTWLRTEMLSKVHRRLKWTSSKKLKEEVNPWSREDTLGSIWVVQTRFTLGSEAEGWMSRRQNDRTVCGAKLLNAKRSWRRLWITSEEGMNEKKKKKKAFLYLDEVLPKLTRPGWNREYSMTYLIIFPPVWEGGRISNCPSPA